MRVAPATEAELRATLEDLLAHPEGKVPSGTDLDYETKTAIERCWAAPSEHLAEVARLELAAQLDGTHEREREARIDAMRLAVPRQ